MHKNDQDPPNEVILWLHLPSQKDARSSRCLFICAPLRWALWHHHILQQRDEGKTARRAPRQPISGLVSLQHLAGTELSGRLEPRRWEGRHLQAPRRTIRIFVKLTEEVEDYVIRWLNGICHNYPNERRSLRVMADLYVFALCKMKTGWLDASLHKFSWGAYSLVFMPVHASLTPILLYYMHFKLYLCGTLRGSAHL